MKLAATEIHVRLEDVYREAALLLLDRRQRKPVTLPSRTTKQRWETRHYKNGSGSAGSCAASNRRRPPVHLDFFETAAVLFTSDDRGNHNVRRLLNTQLPLALCSNPWFGPWRRKAMDTTTKQGPGSTQRRQRRRLACQGSRTFSSYIRYEHHDALEQLKRERGLRNLHETLDLVLEGSQLPPHHLTRSREFTVGFPFACQPNKAKLACCARAEVAPTTAARTQEEMSR